MQITTKDGRYAVTVGGHRDGEYEEMTIKIQSAPNSALKAVTPSASEGLEGPSSGGKLTSEGAQPAQDDSTGPRVEVAHLPMSTRSGPKLVKERTAAIRCIHEFLAAAAEGKSIDQDEAFGLMTSLMVEVFEAAGVDPKEAVRSIVRNALGVKEEDAE